MTQEQRDKMMGEAQELSARKHFRGETLSEDEQARLTQLTDEIRKFDDAESAAHANRVAHQYDDMFGEDGNYVGGDGD